MKSLIRSKMIAVILVLSLLVALFGSVVSASWVASPETWTLQPDKWFLNHDGGTSAADTGEKHGTGSYSIKMTGRASAGTQIVLNNPWTPLSTTTDYTIKVWHKTSGSYSGTPAIKITFLTRYGMPNPDISNASMTIPGTGGNHDWSEISSGTISVPMYTSIILLTLVSETTSGNVWFDEVNVYKNSASGLNLAPNPSFETMHSYMSDASFFGKLNLDYSGLEQVKTAVNNVDYGAAKTELLDYYKNRTSILQLGDRNGTRPTPDPHYDTGLADLVGSHYFTQFNGDRYQLDEDIDWTALSPDGSNQTLAVRNYISFPTPALQPLNFNFDKGVGTVIGDNSGNANHGSIQGTPQWVAGKFDGGLAVNNNTYATVPDSNSLDITDELTVQGWFRWDGSEYSGYGLQKGNAYGLKVVNATAQPIAALYIDGAWREAISPEALSANIWYHIAMTYSSTSREIKLYVNNVLKRTVVLSGLGTYAIHSSNLPLYIGRDAQAWGNNFTGIVDRVSVLNEVTESFNLKQPALNPGLLTDAYWYTGDHSYAEEAIDLILDWYKDNHYREDEYSGETGYAEGTLQSSVVHPGWAPLTTGFRLEYVISILNSVRDSTALTPEKFTAIMKFIYEMAEKLSDRHDINDNGRIAEMKGLYQFAVFFPEFDVSADWLDYSTDQLNSALKELVYPDGAEIELTTLYQVAVIYAGFIIPYQIDKLNNWNSLPDEYETNLENMFNYLMYVSKPDGTLPQINDATQERVKGPLLLGAAEFNRDDMKYVATKGVEGTAPAKTSYAFPYAGQYVMRSGWDANALYFSMDAGPYGVSHQHEDKLSFDLSAYGKNFIADPGVYSYDGDKWRNYFAGSASHSTIMVDHLQQNRYYLNPEYWSVAAPVTDTQWSSNTVFDYVSGKYEDGYGSNQDTSVKQKRIVLFAKPDYWIVRDVLTGSGSHTIQERFQFRNNNVMTIDGTSKIAQTNNVGEANLRIIPVDTSGLDVSSVEGQENSGPSSAYSSDADTKLLLHLDESSGSGTTDASSAGNNGVLQGGAARISGKFNNGIALNADGDYINVPDSNSLDITSDITIEAWIRWDGTTASSYVVNKRYAYGLGVDPSGSPIALVVIGGIPYSVASYEAINKNEWTHIAMTYSSTTRQLRTYINGSITRVYVLSGIGSYAVDSSDYALRVGADEYGNQFYGDMDDVRVSDTVREFQQIEGWTNLRYQEKYAAPMVKYTKTGVAMPTHLDFVFYPTDAAQNPTVTVSREPVTIGGVTPGTHSSSAIKVIHPDGTDFVLLSEANTGDKSFDNYLSDAESALVRLDGSSQVESLSIMNGRKLQNISTGDELIKILSSRAADNISVSFSNSDTVIDIDTTLDLAGAESVKIYAPFATDVRMDGAGVPFQKDGNFIIIGAAPYTADGNTVLLLHIDETTGTNIVDSSGSMNHGTVSGTTKWARSKFANAFSTNAGNGYIRVEDSSSLDITDELTVEGWFMPGDTVQGYGIQKGYAYGLTVGTSTNGGRPVGLVYVDGAFRDIQSPDPLTPGVWHHLAMTYSSVTRTLNLYVNGVLKQSVKLSGLNTYKIATDNQWLSIGRDSNGWGGENIFGGYIDEVRISNVRRSEFSLNSPYIPDSDTSLLLHLDATSGSAVDDVSGNINHGTVYGTADWTSSKFANAISTNAGNGYIRVEDSASLRISNEITVEGWVKGDSSPVDGYIVQKGYGYGLRAGGTYGAPMGLVYVDGAFREISSPDVLSPGIWYHLAMTYSSTTRELKLYVNGVLKASTTLSGLSNYLIETDTNWLAVGRDSRGWGGTNIFHGEIDEVRVSNVVKSNFPYVR